MGIKMDLYNVLDIIFVIIFFVTLGETFLWTALCYPDKQLKIWGKEWVQAMYRSIVLAVAMSLYGNSEHTIFALLILAVNAGGFGLQIYKREGVKL